MKLTLSRSHIVAIIVAIVVISGLAYAQVASQNATDEPYTFVADESLGLTEESQVLLRQRVMSSRSAIAAHEAAGEEVPMELYRIIAESAYFLGDLELAAETYLYIISQAPRDAVVWNNLGNIYVQLGDPDAALDAYAQALAISTSQEYYRDYINLVENYFPEQSDIIEDVLKDYVEQNGQDVWSMVMLADWYLEHDDCDRALDHYEVALDLETSEATESLEEDYAQAKAVCK